MNAPERFDQYVYPDPNSGCFIWAGGSDRRGYGKFTYGSRVDGSRQQVLAHRYAYERVHGPVPAKLHICHKCDTPCCVNPEHLFLGTNADNLRDMSAKCRGRKSRLGLPFGVIARGGRFQARVTVASKSRYLGTFATVAAAAAAALAAKGQG